MKEQVNKLRKVLAERGIDVFVGSSPLVRKYLSDFTGYGGHVIIGQDVNDLATDFTHYEQALIESPEFPLIKLHKDYTIVDYLKEKGFKKIAFEEKFVTAELYLMIKEAIPDVELIFGSEIIGKIRQIKTAKELAGHKKSCEVTNQVVKEFFEYAKVGMTEKELNDFVLDCAKKHGAEGHVFSPITLTGPNACLCHGNPTERKLQEGDFLLLDMGVMYQGYASDVTRTAVMGKASDKQKEIYEIVRHAQEVAIKNIKIGMTAYEAHRLAADVIEEAGYGEYFKHALGHGFKDELIIRDNEIDKNTILEENMVFTVEPGIYIPGFGGVRIEDDVVLTKDGCVSFCTYTTELQEL